MHACINLYTSVNVLLEKKQAPVQVTGDDHHMSASDNAASACMLYRKNHK